MSNGSSLQKGIYEALAASPHVMRLLGGAKIFSQAPQQASFPYLTVGQTAERDWSTGAEDGTEHTVTLHVYSQGGGKQEADEIIHTVREVLNASPLTIDEQQQVNLQHEYSEARHDKDRETYHGIVRYRAQTEPAAA